MLEAAIDAVHVAGEKLTFGRFDQLSLLLKLAQKHQARCNKVTIAKIGRLATWWAILLIRL